jgi:gamma-glutamyl:cysteine ligase YbdK (ATP-grasp superfamily)
VGKKIHKSEFEPHEFEQYRQSLNKNLSAFKELLAQPSFGLGAPSFGAELELYIIDVKGAVKPISAEIHKEMSDQGLTLELNRFNLEYNSTPVHNTSSPFTTIKQQMNRALQNLSECAEKKQARILPIGILPTLETTELGLDAITDAPRYHLMAKTLRNKRGSDFHIHINGLESLDLHWQDVSLEGANTSFQFHYRVNPDNFADAYNAAQLCTPLSVALAANSPILLGKKLWHDTRIALFKQATDYRVATSNHKHSLDRNLPARVLFGHGWLREGIYELFAEGVYLFEPLIPICSDVDPFDELRNGKTPSLSELTLHQGSIWHWNRPIYDPSDDGHLRIELRSLPAGPTTSNMMATAALMSGLMQGLQKYLSTMLPGLPFHYAEKNFYRAAKYGLQANLFWPNRISGKLEERSVIDIISSLLPIAAEGLNQLGVNEREITLQMEVIKGGLESRMNGAQWQINMLDKLLQIEDRKSALSLLVEYYYKQYQSGLPVHEWSQKI